ncbi:MerR family DNA-binding transcriptional regulator [Anaerophilus nitritogenes]|uniref:MerR family DNA-binding transcriptional regulator n=1 Tax=Anaerophilus nitritogenes TaxID=2498136 RepID=UPI00101C507B|nr:MerR family DNA-binding transcriptional regulator [Anaerophilus nitritogenes]
MKDKFLIGELSTLFNISTDTLRYYDKIGLLKPDYDQKNGYRYYSIRNFFKLSRILFLKQLDISLDDIKKYMNHKNTTNLLKLLKKKEEQIDKKINHLTNLKKKINSKIELFNSIGEDINQIRVEKIPERKGVFLDTYNGENNSKIKQSLKINGRYMKNSSWLIEGQVYTSVFKSNILKGNVNQFRYFVEVLSVEDPFYGQLECIPQNEYACIVFLGPYIKIDEYYKVLIQWIQENGYEIIGDSIEKNIVDYDFSDYEEEYISEIQIPIQKPRDGYIDT